MRVHLIANLNWLMLDNIFRLVGGVLVGVWIARYLGVEQYGLLSYALSFVSLFGAVAKLGLDRVVVRDIVRQPEEVGKILGTVFWLKLFAGIIAFFLSIAIAWYARAGDTQFVFLVSVIAVGMLFNAIDSYDIYYQIHLRSKRVVVPRSVAFLFFAVYKCTLIIGAYPIEYFAAAYGLELALGGLLIVWNYQRDGADKAIWLFDKAVLISLLKDGWPLILTSALVVLHTRIDQVMLGNMLDDAAVGVFSVAVRLSEIWLFAPLLLAQSLTPHLLRIKEGNENAYHSRMVQLYSIMFWMGVAVGSLTIMYGEPLIVFLFGEEYRAAYIPMVWIIWTGLFKAQGVAASIWMIGENIQKYRLILNLIAVFMNVGLNLALIPRYGVSGAAFASLLSVGISTWIIPLFFRSMRQMNLDIFRSINPKRLFI